MRAVMLAISVFLASSLTQANVLSFKEWKTRRIVEAKSLITQIKLEKNLEADVQRHRLLQIEMKLQAAKELSPNDYFHLYIMENLKTKPEEIRSVVKKLSKNELAEILNGYVNQTKTMSGLKAPRPNSGPEPLKITQVYEN